ncbi:BTB/POZ and MATH domain-containing protein 1-like [Lolium perenne]|uniref:BTB/POZ and MATH domain-containing protein 1-like n=1 Tax=Lolium perenne TaxID=4522 RepID=UPI0021F59D3B|nr:BTB/POZ and MATH domain-containing protein 1-like [Lolium perenne]
MGAAPSVPDGGDDATAVTGSASDISKVSATHEFTICEYSRTKGMGIGKSILSQYFSVDGRRWFMRFYPDGYSRNDAAWVAFYVQTLYKPQFRAVRAEFTFQLLGANGEVRHTRRSDRACKFDTFCNSWGIRRFISRAQLEAAALAAVHNDSITVRCTVVVHKEQAKNLPVPRPMLADQLPSIHAQNAIRFYASGKAPFDVRFSVGGEVVGAHKMVLAAQSPWFESLLYGPEPANLVDVCGGVVSAEALRGVIHFIYNDELPPAVTSNKRTAQSRYGATLGLYSAADYYHMDRLKMMCAITLGGCINQNTVHQIAEYAKAYSCKELDQACKNFADRRGMMLLPRIEVIQRLISRGGGASQFKKRIKNDVAGPSTTTSQQAAL